MSSAPGSAPAAPPAPAPAAPLPLHPAPPRSGCLKWGLVGCGVLSALLIVGLVVAGLKARSMMEWALLKMQDQTLAACTPEVTEADREAFRKAYAGFIARAREGNVSVEKMTAFRSKLMAAIADGKVTPEELRSVTAAAGETGTPPR